MKQGLKEVKDESAMDPNQNHEDYNTSENILFNVNLDEYKEEFKKNEISPDPESVSNHDKTGDDPKLYDESINDQNSEKLDNTSVNQELTEEESRFEINSTLNNTKTIIDILDTNINPKVNSKEISKSVSKKETFDYSANTASVTLNILNIYVRGIKQAKLRSISLKCSPDVHENYKKIEIKIFYY